jgi:hypothetical protein
MKKILFNPFEKYADAVLLIFGIITNFIGLLLAFHFNVKFLGFLKVDYSNSITPISVLSQSLIIISVFTILLFLIGKIINTKTRFIDVFIAVLLARIPFYCTTFFNFNGLFFQHINKIKILMQSGKIQENLIFDSPIIVVFYIVSILVLIWGITLLYKGFKTATNAKETHHMIYFVVGIVIAELITRTLIYNLN